MVKIGLQVGLIHARLLLYLNSSLYPIQNSSINKDRGKPGQFDAPLVVDS